MKRYVLGFAFNKERTKVLLIKKTHPDWQKDCYNGLGGSVDGDEAFEDAMVREFSEESGLVIDKSRWIRYGRMSGMDWFCILYKAFDVGINEARSMTDEKVEVVDISDLHLYKRITNLDWLIHLAIDPNSPEKIQATY